MRHINYFKSFNESSTKDTDKITLSDDDINLFNSNSVLNKLVMDNKLTILGNDVVYKDDETKAILDEYFN